jgi:hypothetical protein
MAMPTLKEMAAHRIVRENVVLEHGDFDLRLFD